MIPSKAKLRRQKVDPDRTVERLLNAATKLFIAKGFEGTSLNEITSAANLTKPTLYYYFKGKNDLLFYVHIRGLERDLKPYMMKVKAILDPELRCRTMLKEYTRMICSDPALRFLLHGTLGIKDKYAKEIKQAWKEHYRLLCDTIKELQSNGSFDNAISPSSATLLILGMITWITFWYDYGKYGSGKSVVQGESGGGRKRETADDIAALVEKIVFQGLSKSKS